MVRPVRPLGLSLAILASVILFSILPLMQVGLVLILYTRFDSLQPPGTVYFQGADVLFLSNGPLVVQTFFSLLFLGIAVLAWRGRPAVIRRVMTIASLALTGLSLATSLSSINAANGGEAALIGFRLALNLAAALYLVWYINRGRARAFYHDVEAL